MYFLKGFFEKKPGVGGYLVNVPGTGGNPLKERGLEITKIDINNVDLKNIAKDKAIKFSDLNLFLSFGKIFKK